MGIYLRGKFYHYSFHKHGRLYRGTLKTTSLEEARSKYEQLRSAVKRMEKGSLFGAQPSQSEWTALDEGGLRSLARCMAAGMRHRAAKKKLACALSAEDVLGLLKRSGGQCAVTGMPLSVKESAPGRRVSPWAPSIDRIKSEAGYTQSNCRIVCYLANIAMSQYGEEALEVMLLSYANFKWGDEAGSSVSKHESVYLGVHTEEQVIEN